MYKEEMITPAALRLANREGARFLETSFGACAGYLQLNMALIPEKYSRDFEQFCHQNKSACPLIYMSKPGEVEAPLIAQGSDIRTDLAGYKVYKNGEHTDTIPDVLTHPWQDMVSFYLGCSFSFDDKLKAAGIELKQLGIYKSNISCHAAGVFSTDMVVSMRAVPKSIEATINVDFAHGAPIHIGRPEDIGIKDTEESELGFPVKLEPGEVPVFWACGITSSFAIRSAKLPMCFSHSPGCMFVSDTLSNDVPKLVENTVYPLPKTICIDELNSRYSVLSENAWNKLTKIEKEIFEDPGNRGIANLIVESDFHKACLSLSKHYTYVTNHVGITLGFPCNDGFDPIEENDGVHGAIYLAKTLMHLGKQVTFIIDEHSSKLKSTLLECTSKGFFGCSPNILNVPSSLTIDDTQFVFDKANNSVRFSHLISIERACPGADGKHHTMTGRGISEKCDPIHILFEQAQQFTDIVTIGIGDGGNEVGMGKVAAKVRQFIPLGDVIGAATSCDYLIASGVSDWGGMAVACGLFAIRNCPVHDRFQRNGIGFPKDNLEINQFLPDDKEDEALHKFIAEQGFRDGMNKGLDLTVDNLGYYDVHLPKLQTCRKIANS